MPPSRAGDGARAEVGGAAAGAATRLGGGAVDLGQRLTHVTDGDDRAKNRVSAGGGDWRVIDR